MQEAIQQALQGGDLDKALALAREWAEASPDDAAARHALAVALAQSGDPDAALAALDEALRLAPENAWLHMDRAVLLVQGGRLEAAREALDQSLGLDPNLVPAYLAQARLALLRGDLDAAGQALRTAARIAPEGDPHLATVQAMLALRRGDAEQALRHASAAAERLPDDPQLLSVLALAYLARGHLAFAEQALRRVMELAPPAAAKLRPLLAQLVDAQRRPGEAVDVLAPLLEGEAAPALYRAAGLYALRAGRAEEALAHLRRALDGLPDDLAVLDGLMRLWQARGEREQARATLESVLAAHPDAGAAWSARLVLETPGTAEGAQVLERWLAAMPEHVPALHAALFDRERAGDPAGVEAFARRVLALRPEDFVAGRMLAETLLERDAEAALAPARALLAAQTEEAARAGVRSWLGQLLDRAGRPDQALAEWLALHAEHGGRLPPPPPPAEVAGPWPDAAAPAPETQVLLVWGAPGSGVERVVDTLVAGGGPVLRDRFGPRPPDDPLQQPATAAALAAGRLPPDELVARWRRALPARGIGNGVAVDWLPWWDNVLLLALRPHLPEGRLLLALRDPRDMLLGWIAGGAPFALEAPGAAAAWLAVRLEQVAQLHEQDLYPHVLLRLDEVLADPPQLAARLGQALGFPLPPAPRDPRGLPAGRWRAYTGLLADAFARLQPVAVRLGYPEH